MAYIKQKLLNFCVNMSKDKRQKRYAKRWLDSHLKLWQIYLQNKDFQSFDQRVTGE